MEFRDAEHVVLAPNENDANDLVLKSNVPDGKVCRVSSIYSGMFLHVELPVAKSTTKFIKMEVCNSSQNVITSIESCNFTSDDDNATYIHPHWLQYRDVIDCTSDWVINAICLYVGVISIVGFLGNTCVIVAFLRASYLRTASNFLVANLAVSDAAFASVVGLGFLPVVNSGHRRWTGTQATCQLNGFLAGVFGFNSIGTMALIAFDRYRSISCPLEMLYKSTHHRTVLKVGGVWIWSVLLTCPPLVGWGSYIPEGFQMSCTFDYLTRTPSNIIFNYALVVLGFLLPVAVISGCYIRIARSSFVKPAALALHSDESRARMHIGSLTDIELEMEKRRRETHMTKVLGIIVILFVVSWLPYALIAQFGILGLSDLVTPYTTQVPVLVAKTSAVWNPIIYALTGWSKMYQTQKRRLRKYRDWSGNQLVRSGAIRTNRSSGASGVSDRERQWRERFQQEQVDSMSENVVELHPLPRIAA